MAHPDSLDAFRAAWQRFTEDRGFDDIAVTLALEPHAADAESISMSIPLREHLSQANGLYAAAALFGAADITSTFLALQRYADQGQFPLAVQSNLNFLSNSRTPIAVATSRVLRGGSSVVVVESSVADQASKPLVHATFTYILKERALGR